jgi:hypothetical protein
LLQSATNLRSSSERTLSGSRPSASSVPSARTPRLRRLRSQTACTSLRSRSCRRSACSKARRSWSGGTCPARSRSVRATAVTGRPSQLARSSRCRLPTRCRTMPGLPRPRRAGAVTSIRGAALDRSPQSAAALRWLSKALGPQARTAPSTIPEQSGGDGPRRRRRDAPDAAGLGQLGDRSLPGQTRAPGAAGEQPRRAGELRSWRSPCRRTSHPGDIDHVFQGQCRPRPTLARGWHPKAYAS